MDELCPFLGGGIEMPFKGAAGCSFPNDPGEIRFDASLRLRKCTMTICGRFLI